MLLFPLPAKRLVDLVLQSSVKEAKSLCRVQGDRRNTKKMDLGTTALPIKKIFLSLR